MPANSLSRSVPIRPAITRPRRWSCTLTELVDFNPGQPMHAAPHGRRRPCPHQPDALFRQPRRRTRRQTRHGVGGAAAGFPAIRIDGELYWDGGIRQHATEAVFDDNPRKKFADLRRTSVESGQAPEPTTMGEVLNRHKDVQYSSRDRQPYRAPATGASAAPRHQPARRAVAGVRAQQRGGEGN